MTLGLAYLKLVNDEEVFQTKFWPAFQRALATGLTPEQLEVAMAAAKAESAKQRGNMDWGEALAGVIGAAIRAIAEQERL